MSRHKALTGLLVCVLLLVGVTGGFFLWVDNRLDDIPRMDLGLPEPNEDGDTGAPGEALNILMLGTDARDQGALERQMEERWVPGSMRSDTIMVLHVTADRDAAYLVSIPRDTWVDVPGHGMNKINAAFSYGGPELALDTVSAFAEVEMDHVVVIDWEGFTDISTALGGVDVQMPEEGTIHLEGESALEYVRERYSLPDGDFGRIERQQNFLRALFAKMLSAGNLTNPISLVRTLNAVVPSLTVDDSLDSGRIRGTALSMRGVRTGDLTFTTIPLEAYGTRGGGQSVVLVKRPLVNDLFDASDGDRLPEFLRKEGLDTLPAPGSVS